MKLENLVKKGRNGMVAGLLGLTAIGTGGCASTLSEFSEGEGMTLIGAIMRESNDALAIKLAPYVSLLGQMRYQKEVVREGRTQINVNVPENVNYREGRYTPEKGYIWVNPEERENLRVKSVFGSGFAFRWVDYNQSGNPDNLNEYVRRQSRFKENESIVLELIYWAEEPFHQDLKIYDPKGRPVFQYYVDPPHSRRGGCIYNLTGRCDDYLYELSGDELLAFSMQSMAVGINREVINHMLETFGEGEYSAVWRINGKIMDSITFDVIY